MCGCVCAGPACCLVWVDHRHGWRCVAWCVCGGGQFIRDRKGDSVCASVECVCSGCVNHTGLGRGMYKERVCVRVFMRTRACVVGLARGGGCEPPRPTWSACGRQALTSP